MKFNDREFKRYKASMEMEEAILVSLLRNKYESREAEVIAIKMIEYFYDLENTRELNDNLNFSSIKQA
ncbi:MAG: hypothetical protein K0Q51_1150 [Rickettsiaceae bacterium]|jgi:hypothetical protein|nr:hypothetical protein [Rickettsiaceae bacterium]